jgi:hypothetical protein
MNKKSLSTILISLAVLVGMTLPGTLVASADLDSATGELQAANEVVVPEAEAPEAAEGPEATEAPEVSEVVEVPEAAVAPEVPEVAEAAEIPEAAEVPEAEGEKIPALNAEDVQIAAPEEPKADNVSAEAQNFESGKDRSSGASLFDRLMACETLEELFALIDKTPERELRQLNDSEVAAVEAKVAALEPEPLPPVVVETSTDKPVISEIVRPAVNFSKVAPFGDPVVGETN